MSSRIENTVEGTVLVVVSRKHGTYTVRIDEEDAVRIACHRWHANVDKRRNRVYFRTNIRQPDNTRMKVPLQRFIMSTPEGFDTDHVHHDYLDCRKSKLRIVTRNQNNQNSRKTRLIRSSKYKGVTWIKDNSNWGARITHNYKRIHVGYFPGTDEGEIEAAKAYDTAAISLGWVTEAVNFPITKTA